LALDTSISTLLSIKKGPIRGVALKSAVEFAAKPVDVFDAVSHVLAALPHAGEGRIGN